MAESDFLAIGKIVGAHGIRGEIKVQSHAEDNTFFQPGRVLRVHREGGADATFRATGCRPHKRNILLTLAGVDSRGKAEELIGFDIWISKTDLPELEEGTYYWFEMIGLDVYTDKDEYLGRLESIFPTGSNDVYVVRNPHTSAEKLIPALRSVVAEVDLERKRMCVVLPDGL